MKFTNTFLALFGVVVARLTAVNAAVEFCSDINFTGHCDVVTGATGCSNVGSDLNDQISSIHVDSGTICTVFIDFDCGGTVALLVDRDLSDLRLLGFNDNISSFRCNS